MGRKSFKRKSSEEREYAGQYGRRIHFEGVEIIEIIF
jgi:hypothetical protein